MDQPHRQHWFLAQLKPNCAQIALRHLERQGFECFLPLERSTKRRGSRFASRLLPYFPGYMFVAFHNHSAPWRAIRSTQGVARLVSFGAEPTQVPNHIIEELVQNCDEDGCVRNCASLAAGDRVRIASGPFGSFIGQVDRIGREERVWVLLDIMGKATRVALTNSDLRLAS